MKPYSNYQKQKGFSLGCVTLTIVLVISSVFLGIKLGPSYMEYRVMRTAVDDAVSSPDFSSLSHHKIRAKMQASMHRNAGMNRSKLDLNRIAYINAHDGSRVVGFNYEIQIKLFKNMSALLHYKYEKGEKSRG